MKPFELEWLLKSPAFNRTNSTARQLRNDSLASWMDEMLARSIAPKQDSVEDFRVSTNAAAGHTVESFVEQLRQRVGLDLIEKVASEMIQQQPYSEEHLRERALERLGILTQGLKAMLAGHPVDQDLPEKSKEAPQKPVKLEAHVSDAAYGLISAISQQATSNTALNATLKQIDTLGNKLTKSIEGLQKQRGANSSGAPQLTKEEEFVFEALLEAEENIKVLARSATMDAMPGISSAPEPPKEASKRIPLSKSANDEAKNAKKVLTEMAAFLKTYHLRPTHALKEPEALFFELKTKFGVDTVQQIGREPIMEMIERLRKEMEEPHVADNLPAYDGAPMQLKEEPEKPSEQKPKR